MPQIEARYGCFFEDLIKYILCLNNCNTICKKKEIKITKTKNKKKVQNLKALLEKLKKSKDYVERNKIQANTINTGLRGLKKEIEDMSEQEKETENPNEIVDIVEMILEFNRQDSSKDKD